MATCCGHVGILVTGHGLFGYRKNRKNYRITFQLVEFSLQCETINSYFVWEVGNQKNVSLTWIKRDAFTFILFRVDLGDESTHALDRMACKGD